MSSEFSVKVNKVPAGTLPDELRAVFEAAGFTSITDVYLPEKFAKFEFGFVRFRDLEEARMAAATQGLAVGGVALACELATADRRKVGATFAAPRGGPFGKGAPVGKGAPFGKGGYAVGSSYAAVEAPRMPEAGAKTSNEYSIWVGSLPPGTTSDDIREAFASRGVMSMTDVYLPPSRDYGFVRFATSAEAAHAMESCSQLQVSGQVLELRSSTTGKRSVGVPAQIAAAPAPQADWAGGCCGKGAERYLPPVQGRASAYAAGPGNAAGPGTWAAPAPCGTPSLEAGRGSNEYSIWVGALPEGVTKEDLQDAFRMYGVESMTDIYIPPGRDFGFIRFATYAEAEDAMRHCGAFTVQGSRVELKLSIAEKRSVGVGRPMTPVPEQPVYGDGYVANYDAPGCGSTAKASDLEVSIKVGNLSPGTTTEDLKEAFLTRGITTMSDVYIPRNKSFGFVRFQSLSEAQMAMECVGMPVLGSPVTLEMAEGEKRSSVFFTGSTAPVAAAGPGWIGQGVQGGCGGKGLAGACAATAPPPARNGEFSLKVGNLPPGTTPEEVCQCFSAHGIDSMTDCYLPQGRRFGFLRFTTAAEGRYALQKQMWIRGHQLELEPALGTKRTPEEMLESEMTRQKRPALARDFGEAPHDPNISPDAPSVKASGMPPGTTAQELHKALLDAGCTGMVTDVYVPKGNRGFGFVRFASAAEAEATARLEVWIRGASLGLEIAVQERKAHGRLEVDGGMEDYGDHGLAEVPGQAAQMPHAGGWY